MEEDGRGLFGVEPTIPVFSWSVRRNQQKPESYVIADLMAHIHIKSSAVQFPFCPLKDFII
jgi:hypothetical protein